VCKQVVPSRAAKHRLTLTVLFAKRLQRALQFVADRRQLLIKRGLSDEHRAVEAAVRLQVLHQRQ
jgi:hypothetical protein